MSLIHTLRSESKWLSFYTLIIPLFLISCAASPSNDDFLTGTPCQAPCWQGIIPGQTDEQTALAIISDPDLVIQDSLRKTNGRYLFRRTPDSIGNLILENGVVTQIRLSPANHLALEDIVDTFFTPDFVYVQDASSEWSCYSASLYDLENGIWIISGKCKQERNGEHYALTLDNKGNIQANINRKMDVGIITFFEPRSDLKSALIDSLLFAPDDAQMIVDHANSWSGFGPYDMVP